MAAQITTFFLCMPKGIGKFDPELHDQHNDYPLAQEKFTVSPGMLSPYFRDLANETQDDSCNQIRSQSLR